MYKIAEFFPPEARRAALGHDYTEHSGAFLDLDPRTQDGFCPFGHVLRQCLPNYRGQTPDYVHIADAAEQLARKPADAATLERLALVFTRDWDTGKITDLAKALGVKP